MVNCCDPNRARIPEGTKKFLPEGGCARLLVGLLALPAFAVCMTFLVAVAVLFPGSSNSGQDILMLILWCQLFGMGAIFTSLSIIWAVAVPRWVSRLLEPGAQRLVSNTGGFMLSTAASLASVAINLKHLVVGALALGGFLRGAHFLYIASRYQARRAVNQRGS